MRIARALKHAAAALTLSIALPALTACASAAPDTSEPAPDPNREACVQVDQLWDEVVEWGTTPGNTKADGLPTIPIPSAPNFKVMLDGIRQPASGVVRTTLDEYYDWAPGEGALWYGNGAYTNSVTHDIEDACAAIDQPISNPTG